jgi:hypothetical protein
MKAFHDVERRVLRTVHSGMKAFQNAERAVPQTGYHSVSFSQSFSARKTPPKQKAFCTPFV